MKQATVASAAVPAIAQAQDAAQRSRRRKRVNPLPVRVGMTDWNLGQRGDITKIALAREIGLDGIQVSVQYPTDGKRRRCAIRRRRPRSSAPRSRTASRSARSPSAIPGKSRLPMHTNPAFAILLAEAVEIAHNLGTNNILLPILGDSHIDMTNQAQVDTFVAMMKEVARYAEKYERRRRPRRLDLGRGQHQAARRDRIGLRRRLLRRAQHRVAREGHLRRAEDARQAHPARST